MGAELYIGIFVSCGSHQCHLLSRNKIMKDCNNLFVKIRAEGSKDNFIILGLNW